MTLAPGSRLGPYTIESLLGVGGMGEVYRAVDTRLSRTVAIKVLSAKVAESPRFRERFTREARALSAVEHPNICALYDVGREGDLDYLVMQYVEGESLAQRLARGPIPVGPALDLARQMAAGLAAAHERGILHRDFKPANVRLTPEGQARILDFGIAKSADPIAPDAPTVTEAITEDGGVVGTPGYMSPEQAAGGAVDRRTDAWAFGCVLYEMLAGKPAFPGRSLILGAEADWTLLPAETPARVRVLLQRCLRRDVRRRQRDLGDALLDLEEMEASPVVPAPARARWPMLLGAAVAGIALAGVASALLWTGREAPPMRFSTVTNLSGVEAQPALSPDGRSVAFVSNRDGQWDVYVALVAGGPVVRVTNDPAVEARPRWSPDGARLVFSRLNETGRQDAWVVSSLGGGARRIVLDAAYPTWSPDGRSIAYASRGAIWECEASGEKARAVTRAQPPLVHLEPAYSRDGRRLAFVERGTGPSGELAIADRATGDVRFLTHDGALAWSPVWSADDAFLYFTSSRGGTMNVWKVPTRSGEAIQITAGQGADADIDLSLDGKRLVFSSFRTNLNLAEVSLLPGSLGQSRWLTTDAARGELGPRYSPDGARIAYFSNRDGAEREGIWVMDADGDNPVSVVEDDLVNVRPRWTASGQDLVFVSRPPGSFKEFQLRRVSLAGGAPQALPLHPWRSAWGDVAPDDRLLCQTTASAGELYDLRSGRTQPVSDLPGEPLWSPDGEEFAYPVRAEAARDADMGVWVGTLAGARRQVFRGCVTSFVWEKQGTWLVLEGKPDLNGILWRVDAAGRRTLVLPRVGLYRGATDPGIPLIRFDVSPDGSRMVLEAVEALESDIGLIENVR